LENVWKFIGFSNKANAKRLLKQHFTENKDYKLIIIRTDENKTLLIRTDEQKNKDETRGRKEETEFLLTYMLIIFIGFLIRMQLIIKRKGKIN
jgi:hypothetical protein